MTGDAAGVGASGAPANKKKKSRTRDYDIATHWQLMWWKFKRHHMAILGLSLLAVFLVISLVPEFLAPYKPHSRNLRYSQGPPMGIHWFDP